MNELSEMNASDGSLQRKVIIKKQGEKLPPKLQPKGFNSGTMVSVKVVSAASLPSASHPTLHHILSVSEEQIMHALQQNYLEVR